VCRSLPHTMLFSVSPLEKTDAQISATRGGKVPIAILRFNERIIRPGLNRLPMSGSMIIEGSSAEGLGDLL
jgi:hypothetical protein